MQFILNPIIKNGLFLFFVFLLIVSLILTFRQKVYHESVLARASTDMSGYFDEKISRATSFINLSKDNRVLQLENAELRKELEMLKGEMAESDMARRNISNLEFHQTYDFIPAEIINNSIVKSHNMITINKGARHGVEKGMGIISSRGVVGYVYNTSENYSRVMSTLNKHTRINARIRGNEYFGTVRWDGEDPRFVQLTEIPKYIKVEKGDTIETDGKSPAIPGGIMIGTIHSAEIDEISGELNIRVRLKEDFGRLRYAQVVLNLEKQEIMKVESDSIVNNVQP